MKERNNPRIPSINKDKGHKSAVESLGRRTTELLNDSVDAWDDLARFMIIYIYDLLMRSDPTLTKNRLRDHFLITQLLASWEPGIIKKTIARNGDVTQLEITIEQMRYAADIRKGVEGEKAGAPNRGVLALCDNELPKSLRGWCRSKRAFSLDEQSAASFIRAHYPDYMQMKDIPLPLDTFIIELPIPLINDDNTWAVRSILITTSEPRDKYVFNLRLFGNSVNNGQIHRTARMLSNREREVCDAAVRYVRDASNKDLTLRKDGKTVRPIAEARIVLDKLANQTELRVPFEKELSVSGDTTLDDFPEKELNRKVLAVVVGTCLYMAHGYDSDSGQDLQGNAWQGGERKKSGASPQQKTPSNGVPAEGTFDVTSIFDIKRIHEIGASKTKNVLRMKVVYMNADGRVVEAHPRIGHKRRPPNSPSDAPRTVSVRPTWVGVKEGEPPSVAAGIVYPIKLPK